MINLLVKNGIIVTMDSDRKIFFDGSVAINEGRIIDVGKAEKLSHYRAEKEVSARGKVVLPGLINAHAHIHPLLMRRILIDLKMDVYRLIKLSSGITERDCYNIGLLACSEMIKSGTTCVLDNNFVTTSRRNVDMIAKAVERIGMRAVIAPGNTDIDPRYPKNELFSIKEAVKEYIRVIKEWDNRGDGRIKVWLGPSIPGIYASTELMREVGKIAEDYNVGITVHLSETLQRVEEIRKKYGFKGHVDYVYDMGLLGPNVLAAHCIWVTEREIQKLCSTGTKVVHVPASNMYMGRGIAPVPHLLDSGIKVALGTDGGNPTLDMFQHMRFAALLHKVAAFDSSVITAYQVLEMATINGAVALGLENDIGSIEKGKKADLILVDLQKPHLIPLHKVTSTIVYGAKGSDVDMTIVDGKILFENREIKTANEEDIIKNATKSANSILKKSGFSQLLCETWPVY